MALVLTAALPPLAAAYSSGTPGVAAEIGFEHVPHCKVGLGDEVCVAGYNDNRTSSPSDDTLYAYQSTKRVAVYVDTEPLKPLGAHGLLPRKVSVDAESTAIEHPLFIMISETGKEVNDTLPPAAKEFVELREGLFSTYAHVRVPGSWIGLFDVAFNVPVPYGFFAWSNKTHLKPLDDEVLDVWSTDYYTDVIFGPNLSNFGCRESAGIPTPTLVPPACPLAIAAAKALNTGLKANLPNVVCCADTSGGDVVFRHDRSNHANVHEPEAPASAPSNSVNPPSPSVDSDTTMSPINEGPRAIRGILSTSHPATSAATQGGPSLGALPAMTPGDGWIVAAIALFAIWLLFLYSRISKDRILENENRRRIYEFVQRNPGVTKGAIARKVGLSYPTVDRHVVRLVRAGLLVQRKEGNLHLYENQGAMCARTRLLLARFQSPAGRSVIAQLTKRSGITQAELVRTVGLPRATVILHADKLVAVGAVAKEKRGRNRALLVTSEWKEPLREYLERFRGDVSADSSHSS